MSYVGEPPETPAPLFVVRAFKTAIFGTPHPVQREAKSARKTSEKDKGGSQRPAPEIAQDEEPIERDAGVEIERAASIKFDNLASPAKGILLTPGTTATRRKTVSFLHLEDSDAGRLRENVFQGVELKMDPLLTPSKSAPEAQTKDEPRHSKLTKTLLELSKQKSKRKDTSAEVDVQLPEQGALVSTAIQTESDGSAMEVTVDLSKPRSRSGQHWKTEYEQYQRRSNREMKEIIKYGQTVKSYAAKKDAEATSLSERLKKELAKVARMESRVSKLAARLNAVEEQGPEGESEQARLVTELAHQTALTIRYKHKVDRYKAAISEQNVGETADGDQDDSKPVASGDSRGERLLSQPETNEDPAIISKLQAQIEDLHRVSQAAEDRSRQLETENRELKRSLARVKQEMMSYETRRQAREERLKRSEAKHKAAKEECEKRLAQLTGEHQELLRTTNRRPIAHEAPRTHAAQLDGITSKSPENRKLLKEGIDENSPPAGANVKPSKSSYSARKSRSQDLPVDIWTSISPPETTAADKTPSQERTHLPPSSVRYDIHRTLKEIDQNLLPEQSPKENPPPPPIYSNTNRYPRSQAQPPSQNSKSRSISPLLPSNNNNNKLTRIDSSTINFASSPAKLQATDFSYSKPTVGRSASLLFTTSRARGSSRPGTMGSSGRAGSALSAERAAAAKARLAKRSAEKKRRVGSGL